MRRLLLVAAALAVVFAVAGRWRAASLPAPYAPTGSLPHASVREIRTAYHVHTTRSDGTGTPESIADAALKAGLDAVILTDHGDGTRPLEPARRIQGVLLVDAVEISTWGGHYVALGARPSPYPLGGDPAAVVDDVARLGGLGIAAHPASPKPDLKWRAWDAPFDGLEWLNADSEWRDRPQDLWAAVPAYPWAPSAVIASLLDRPVLELAEWDRRAARRPTVGLAAHDAHARLGLSGVGEPYDGAVALEVPGYGAMFRTFANVVRVPADGWGEEAARDGDTLVQAIREGRTYTVVTALGGSWVTAFRATSGTRSATMGQSLVPEGPVRIEAEVEAPASATSTLVCDGRAVTRVRGGRVSFTANEPPGACRLEVTLGADAMAMPWIVTNPIYVRHDAVRETPMTVTPPTVVRPVARSEAAAWTIEAAAGASATVASDPSLPQRATLQWTLGPTASTYAAMAMPTPGELTGFDRLVLRAHADRPRRMWVQLRVPAMGGRRWGRSVYLDTTPQTITLPLASFLPLDGQAEQRVPLDQVTALLLVADTINARPGDRGRVTFDEWSMAR